MTRSLQIVYVSDGKSDPRLIHRDTGLVHEVADLTSIDARHYPDKNGLVEKYLSEASDKTGKSMRDIRILLWSGKEVEW